MYAPGLKQLIHIPDPTGLPSMLAVNIKQIGDTTVSTAKDSGGSAVLRVIDDAKKSPQ